MGDVKERCFGWFAGALISYVRTNDNTRVLSTSVQPFFELYKSKANEEDYKLSEIILYQYIFCFVPRYHRCATTEKKELRA